jgi:cellulose 1,4-beta-cellobiosidase
MAANGDASALNKAGPKYGTGYCDAQCPKNTFVKGVVSYRHVTQSFQNLN